MSTDHFRNLLTLLRLAAVASSLLARLTHAGEAEALALAAMGMQAQQNGPDYRPALGRLRGDRARLLPPAGKDEGQAARPAARRTAGVVWLSERVAWRDQRPLFVLLTSHGCGPCVEVERLLADPAVVAALDRFACVRLKAAALDRPLLRFADYGVGGPGGLDVPTVRIVHPNRLTMDLPYEGTAQIAALLDSLIQE